MTFMRCTATSAAMALVGWGLWLLSPGTDALVAASTDPQRVVDTAGADAVLVPLAWAVASLCWSWGALGLGLTVPGAAGRVADVLLGVVLPAGLRQVAAVAVGVSLATVPVVASAAPVDRGAPVATSAQKVAPAGTGADEVARGGAGWSGVGGLHGGDTAVADASAPVVPDWPTAPGTGGSADEHVVLRGDCLWDIAETWLTDRSSGPVTPAATAAAVQAWWEANTDVVGPDPDLLLPGQVLRAPTLP